MMKRVSGRTNLCVGQKEARTGRYERSGVEGKGGSLSRLDRILGHFLLIVLLLKNAERLVKSFERSMQYMSPIHRRKAGSVT